MHDYINILLTDLFPGGFSVVALSVSDTAVSGGCKASCEL